MPRNTFGSVKCHAHKSNGDPCPQWAMRGQQVCWSHGGASPQARAKADERLQALVFPALEVIAGYVERREPEKGVPSAVRLRAAEAILDRAGYSATHRVEMSGEMTVVSPVDLELEEIAARLEKARESVEDVSQ